MAEPIPAMLAEGRWRTPDGRLCRRPAVVTIALSLLLGALVTLPYVLADRWPPARRFSTGAIAFQDDIANYASYVEQARRGALLFYDKFDWKPHRPMLLNPGWWAAGVLARVTHLSPPAGFRLFTVVAVAVFVGGCVRMLRACGRRGASLWWSTLLVATGGGAGGVAALVGSSRSPADLYMAFYPFWQMLMGAHATLATGLSVWTVTLMQERREGGARGPWIACGTLLGLCRGFDLAPVLAAATLLACLDLRRGRGASLLDDLPWFAPVLLYDACLFGFHPSFSTYRGPSNVVSWPGALDLLLTLGPAGVLAAWPWRRDLSPTPWRQALLAWAIALVVLAVAPVTFAGQFANSAGTVLLLLAAVRVPTAVLSAATFVLSPTALFLLWWAYHPAPTTFAPDGYRQAAETLRARCAPRDVVLGPIDPSLVIAANTSCSVALGHQVQTPDFAQRVEEARRFYDPATPAWWRRVYLDTVRARFVLLPTDARGLGDGAPWRMIRSFPGFELWERVGPPPPI